MSVRHDIAELLPELRGYARFLVRGRAEADDLVQDALVRALAAIDGFEPGTSLKAWLFTIQRNVFYEQARRRRTERAVMGRAAVEHGSAMRTVAAPHQDGQIALDDLARLLWTLSPVLREALVLVGARGLSNEEAAAICAVPVGTIKARVSRARSQIARAMTGQDGGPMNDQAAPPCEP